MSANPMTSVLTVSDRIYRLLLAAYPADYRDEYGPHMAQVFRDMCRDAYRQGGAWGVLGSWLPVLLDLAITAFEEHRKEEIRMSLSVLARWGGAIVLIGGVLFGAVSFSQLQPGSHYTFYGVYRFSVMLLVPALWLLALGLAGVRAQFAARLNPLGRWGLNLAVAGAVIQGIAWLGLVVSELLYAVFMAAWLVHLVGMLLFGISALQTRVLPRWNALPIIISLLPFLMFLNNNRGEAYGPQYATFIAIALMGLGYALLGLIVHSNISQREAAAA